jgi:LysR family transcriptional regulator, regulator for genes of the gallate degradation pathway
LLNYTWELLAMPAQPKFSHPTLRRLAIFDAVIRTGSAGLAAQDIGLSQPAVTHALDKLESEVGGRLFDRGPGGSAPTKAGRILHRRVERMLKQAELGLGEARAGVAGQSDLRLVSRSLTTPQVRAHLAIVDLGSFRAAARALAMAEPTLHRAARDFERVVGAPLYRRTPRGVSAAPAGLALAGRLRLALYEIEQALDELGAERGAAGGRIFAGCLPLMPKSVLARTVGRLIHAYPNVEVEIEEASHEALMQALRSSELDVVVGALRSPRLAGDVVEQALFNDPHVAVARAGHPLAAGATLRENDLATFPWVAPSRNTPRRAFIEDLFDRLPTRPRIVAETSSLAVMTAILRESDCLTLMSRAQAMDEFQSAGVSMLPIDLQAAERMVGVTTRSGWLPTLVQRRFLTLLRQECHKLAT